MTIPSSAGRICWRGGAAWDVVYELHKVRLRLRGHSDPIDGSITLCISA